MAEAECSNLTAIRVVGQRESMPYASCGFSEQADSFMLPGSTTWVGEFRSQSADAKKSMESWGRYMRTHTWHGPPLLISYLIKIK